MYHFHLINCTLFFSTTILPAQLVDLTKSRIHWNAKWWWLNDCDLVGTFRANNKTHTTMSSISDTLHSSFLFTSPFHPPTSMSSTFSSATAYFSGLFIIGTFFFSANMFPRNVVDNFDFVLLKVTLLIDLCNGFNGDGRIEENRRKILEGPLSMKIWTNGEWTSPKCPVSIPNPLV